MHKLRRLLTILELLQSGRSYNAREISEQCGVSKRQVFRDLNALQQSGVSILYDPSRQTYWLPEPNYLPPLELTVPEVISLLVAAFGVGDAEQGVPGLQPAAEAASKLLGNLPTPLREHVGELPELTILRIDANSTNSRSRDAYVATQRALAARKKIRIEYDSLYEQKRFSTLVSPYRLVFFGRAWYLIGRSSRDRAVRTFHLGRVLKHELTDDTYSIPQRFSVDRYFGKAWRMIREPGNLQTVKLRFQPMVSRNVGEVLWHKTQKLTWNDDGTLDFEVRVEGLREIEWWIMGYADQVEVLEPIELRKMVVGRIESMRQTYRKRPASKSDESTSSSAPAKSTNRKPSSNSGKPRSNKRPHKKK
ncbi:MAG: WYL domain-containing protein [Planctomycetaceae bacterium]